MCFSFGCLFPVCRKSWWTVAKTKAQKLKILQPKMLTMWTFLMFLLVKWNWVRILTYEIDMNIYKRQENLHAKYMQIYVSSDLAHTL